MTDWAADSAAQMLSRHAQIRGERTVIVDGAALEREITAALRLAKRMGEIDHAIMSRVDLREVVAGP